MTFARVVSILLCLSQEADASQIPMHYVQEVGSSSRYVGSIEKLPCTATLLAVDGGSTKLSAA